MAQPGHTVNGCYKLQEKVGEYRFFTTWRATALYSPSSFSLTFLTFPYKDVPKRAFDEFRRLFLSLYTFQNPYVLTPFEYDESAETKYLASHWIRGYSLREAIDNGEFSEKDQVINTAVHILRGLAELERIGVRHDILTPKSLLLSSLNSEYDIPRIRNIGFSLFVDALGAQSEYRDLPRYRKDSLQGGRSHERDLYAAGAIIAELVSAVEQTVPMGELSTLTEIAGSFCENPGSFASIADALTQMLTLYPEKRTVDLIQEHSVDTSGNDTMTKDLYRSIEARYEATRRETYELHRSGLDSTPPQRELAAMRNEERPTSDRDGDDAATAEVVEEAVDSDDEVIELLPPAPEDGPRGLFARAVSAVRRLFSRRSAGRRRGAPADREGAGDAVVTHPDQGGTTTAPEAESGEGYRTVDIDDGDPITGGDNSRPPRAVDTSHILEIFRKLREHFIGTIHRETTEPHRVSRARRTHRPPPWHGALDDRDRNRERYVDGAASRNIAPQSEIDREHGGGEEPLPDGITGEGKEKGRQNLDREADGTGGEYDFKTGPEYAPGERLDLDDEAGDYHDIDFGDSALRTDRDEPDDADSSSSKKGTPSRSMGPKARRSATADDGDQGDAQGGPIVNGGAAARKDVSRVEKDGDIDDHQESVEVSASSSHDSDGSESADGTGSHGGVSKAGTPRRPRWFWRLVSFLRSVGRRLGNVITGRRSR
ncbi:MAG: hypothetical protein MI724_03065 [Spirochaetales bacterium]|nr:hypothetical protein [Spirochaetales bacterium]